MRSALIVGVSVVALGLGGCSWVERTTGIGGGEPSARSQPAATSSMSGSSQAPPREQAQSGSTSSKGAIGHPARMASNEVRQAQQKLKDDGDYTGQIDGLAGPQTHQAVMAYQKKNNLKVTGRLDRQTREKLGLGGTGASGSSTPSGSSMSPAPSGNPPASGSAPSGTDQSAGAKHQL